MTEAPKPKPEDIQAWIDREAALLLKRARVKFGEGDLMLVFAVGADLAPGGFATTAIEARPDKVPDLAIGCLGVVKKVLTTMDAMLSMDRRH